MPDSNDEQTPSPSAAEPRADRPPLTAREQAIFEELSLLDPELAGLFERGFAELQGSANPYVLAHIGRELSNGVAWALIELGTADPSPMPADIPDDDGVQGLDAVATDDARMHAPLNSWPTAPPDQ